MSGAHRPAPRLPAPEPPWFSALRHEGVLREVARSVAGPFHLVHPATFAATLCRWADIGRERDVQVAIRFGKKANKSMAFARECARATQAEHGGLDTGVDVASAEEFTAALAAGNRGEQLVVTGPTHPEPLLRLASQHRALVAISTLDDLRRAARVVGETGLDVLLRLRTEPTSRFGMTEAELAEALTASATGCLRLRGVSFHCSGYEVADRVAAFEAAVKLVDAGRALGHRLDTVSAGGGWPVSHIAPDAGRSPAQTWQRHREALRPEHFLTGEVPSDLYPYGIEPSGENALAAFLDAGPATALRQRDLTLVVEPGRALCTAAGVSAFPVLSTQERPDLGPGIGISVVDGTSLSLSEQWYSSEFCLDPWLLDADGSPVETDSPVTPFGTAVAGRTCLESDLLSRRFVPLPRTPAEGDLLVYPDTAGYQMDSNESAFHDIPVPPKFAVHGQNPYVQEDA